MCPRMKRHRKSPSVRENTKTPVALSFGDRSRNLFHQIRALNRKVPADEIMLTL
jgi:hypothetical protein